MYDLIVRGGLVVDGTGAPGVITDVAVKDGKIRGVGPHVREEGASKQIDATGLVVAPGFIDIHTHYDAQLLWDPSASPSSLHGVTTVVAGNGGFALAPCSNENADYQKRLMSRVEGIPLAALDAGLDWDWSTFQEWFEKFEGNLGVNAGFLAGHSTIRRAVMGSEAVGGTPTALQQEQMETMLSEILQAGALGFSTSQMKTHFDGDGRPVPSRSAGRDELLGLCRITGRHPGTTIGLTNSGSMDGFSDDEIDLMTAMSVAGNRPVNWKILLPDPTRPEHLEHQLSASDEAVSRGGSIVALTLPHLPLVRLKLTSSLSFEAVPVWVDLVKLPIPERIRALADADWRRRLRAAAEAADAGSYGRRIADWPEILIGETFSPANQGDADRTVGEIAAERGTDPFETFCDVVVADELRTDLYLAGWRDTSKENWKKRAEVWLDPRTVIGGSDSGAHVDVMCGARYTTDFLGHGVREKQLVSLEEAIRQMTDVPARLYGLKGVGRLAEGYQADMVLFDPETVSPNREREFNDLPGGASRLVATSNGIARVMVAGVDLILDNQVTGETPGTLLRSGVHTSTVTAC